MSKQNYRIAVVGASSLLGKEIAEELAGSTHSVLLMDGDEEASRLEQVGDEAVIIQAVEPASFEGVDVTIFATGADATKYLSNARALGTAVVDAGGDPDPATPVRSQSVPEAGLDLETETLAAAHPVTTMLAAVLQPLARLQPLQAAFATVLQPASENGAPALDEMHQQTVNLLSFQALPTAVFDTQAAFNLQRRFGDESTATLGNTADLVRRQLGGLLGGNAMLPTLQFVQAPVFHGFGISLFVQFAQPVAVDAAEQAFSTELLELVNEDDAPASNTSVAGESRVQVEIRPVPTGARESSTFALWLVADNLKLAAGAAVAAANQLLRLRPRGKVQ